MDVLSPDKDDSPGISYVWGYPKRFQHLFRVLERRFPGCYARLFAEDVLEQLRIQSTERFTVVPDASTLRYRASSPRSRNLFGKPYYFFTGVRIYSAHKKTVIGTLCVFNFSKPQFSFDVIDAEVMIDIADIIEEAWNEDSESFAVTVRGAQTTVNVFANLVEPLQKMQSAFDKAAKCYHSAKYCITHFVDKNDNSVVLDSLQSLQYAVKYFQAHLSVLEMFTEGSLHRALKDSNYEHSLQQDGLDLFAPADIVDVLSKVKMLLLRFSSCRDVDLWECEDDGQCGAIEVNWIVLAAALYIILEGESQLLLTEKVELRAGHSCCGAIRRDEDSSRFILSITRWFCNPDGKETYTNKLSMDAATSLLSSYQGSVERFVISPTAVRLLSSSKRGHFFPLESPIPPMNGGMVSPTGVDSNKSNGDGGFEPSSAAEDNNSQIERIELVMPCIAEALPGQLGVYTLPERSIKITHSSSMDLGASEKARSALDWFRSSASSDRATTLLRMSTDSGSLSRTSLMSKVSNTMSTDSILTSAHFGGGHHHTHSGHSNVNINTHNHQLLPPLLSFNHKTFSGLSHDDHEAEAEEDALIDVTLLGSLKGGMLPPLRRKSNSEKAPVNTSSELALIVHQQHQLPPLSQKSVSDNGYK